MRTLVLLSGALLAVACSEASAPPPRHVVPVSIYVLNSVNGQPYLTIDHNGSPNGFAAISDTLTLLSNNTYQEIGVGFDIDGELHVAEPVTIDTGRYSAISDTLKLTTFYNGSVYVYSVTGDTLTEVTATNNKKLYIRQEN